MKSDDDTRDAPNRERKRSRASPDPGSRSPHSSQDHPYRPRSRETSSKSPRPSAHRHDSQDAVDPRRGAGSPSLQPSPRRIFDSTRRSSRSLSRQQRHPSRSVSTARSRSRRDFRSRSSSQTPRSRDRSRSPSSSNRTRSESYDAPPITPPDELVKPNFKPCLVLHGHSKPVSQVRISPNGKFVASASADGTVKIWDSSTGANMDTLVGHMAGVSCLAWSPDSNTIATGSDDKAIRLWDRMTGRPKTTTRKTVTGQDMPPLRGHHNYVHCLAFSPKGNILASGSYDEAVFLWDVRAGRLMRSLPAHSDPVSGIDFCADGTLVASCSTDGLIRIWDTSTGQCLRTLVHEDNPAVTNVCFSPNGRFVLASSLDNCIRLWDYVSGSVKKTYQGHENEKFAVGGCFGLLNGEPFIASASEDGDILLWDVKSKAILQKVKGHKGVCFWVDTHEDQMVSAGQDGLVRVYRHQRSSGEGGEAGGKPAPGVGQDGSLGVLPIRQEALKTELTEP